MQLQKRTPKTDSCSVSAQTETNLFTSPCMLLQDKQLFQLDSSDFLDSGNAKTFLPVISQVLRRCRIKVKFMAGFRCSSGNILLNNYCNVLIFIASYCSNPRV